MAVRSRNLDALTTVEVLAPTAVTAAVDTTAVDLSAFDDDVLLVLQAAGSGAGNTMQCKVQHGDESNGSDAEDVAGAVFPELGENAYCEGLRIKKGDLKKYIRLSFHTEGGTYSAAASCTAVGLLPRR
ncbi:MAG: hypothetical protein AAFX65_10590 [Cyanobacteria bacterium J06638_7]